MHKKPACESDCGYRPLYTRPNSCQVIASAAVSAVGSASGSVAGSAAAGGGGGASGGSAVAVLSAVQFVPLLAQLSSDSLEPAYRDFAASLSIFSLQMKVPAVRLLTFIPTLCHSNVN